jgi:hypothetical protein
VQGPEFTTKKEEAAKVLSRAYNHFHSEQQGKQSPLPLSFSGVGVISPYRFRYAGHLEISYGA